MKFQEKSQGDSWLTSWAEYFPAAPKPDEKPLREAAGKTIDADEDQWRRLSGDGQRDLAPMTQRRMQKLAHYQWETNLLANRLIELPIAYMLSQGVKLTVDDEDAQDAIDRHWSDGLNNWDIKLPMKARELALFGEQCYPIFRDEQTGRVRLGYLDPSVIETVVTDPDNCEQAIGVVTRRNKHGEARRYRIVVNVPESAFSERTQEIRKTFGTGDCFFFRVNGLSAASRGRSDLLAQIDWLDSYDQYLFGELDGAGFRRAFVWDVTLTGADQDEVNERAKKITAPKPGSVRVHNENEAWEAKAPELNAADSAEGARLFRNQVLGGATVPEHWYGGAADVNRSTGSSMAEPTEKILDMRQRYLGYMLEEIGRFVVRSHWQRLDAELTDEQMEILDSLRAEWPEMTAKDTTKYAAALGQIVAAIVAMLDDGLITRVRAVQLIAQMADRLGVSIDDPERELIDAENERAERGGDNLGGINLTDRPPPTPPANDGAGTSTGDDATAAAAA